MSEVLSLLGETLLQPDGTEITTAAAVGSKPVLALYFSAHWCPPCRGFTPTLCEKYTALKDAGKDFELVFVSSDKDEAACKEYHSSMNFLGLPYALRGAKAKLSKMFKVNGIPTLVFHDLAEDKLITTNGREEVTDCAFIANFPYRPEHFSKAPLGASLGQPKEEMANVLMQRLEEGPILCAEGYLFALERRGLLQIGPFVPEAVLTQPEAVEELTREFLLAGSDVALALTYFGCANKLALMGTNVERFHAAAVVIAQRAAASVKKKCGRVLVAGNIGNTPGFDPSDKQSIHQLRAEVTLQVQVAKSNGVDFIIGETFDSLKEGLLVTEAIVGAGLPAVITLAPYTDATSDGVPFPIAMQQLEEAGAAIVGLNCARGPAQTLRLLRKIRKTFKGRLAALPVAYNTTAEHRQFKDLCQERYQALEPFQCTRLEVAEFTRECLALDPPIDYIGLCCGAAPYHIRTMAEGLGRQPPASRYTADAGYWQRPPYWQQAAAMAKEQAAESKQAACGRFAPPA